jgi:hypothetical protein
VSTLSFLSYESWRVRHQTEIVNSTYQTTGQYSTDVHLAGGVGRPTGNHEVARSTDLLLGADENLSRNLHIVNRHDPVGVMALSREHGGSLVRHFWQDDGRFEYSGAMIWMDSQGKFKALDTVYFGYMRIMNYVWSCFRDDAKDHGSLTHVQKAAPDGVSNAVQRLLN